MALNILRWLWHLCIYACNRKKKDGHKKIHMQAPFLIKFQLINFHTQWIWKEGFA